MAGSWLNSFVGQRATIITVSYNEEKTDTGTILEMGEGWMQMVKDNGDMILIPNTAVRIVKLLDMTHALPADVRANPPAISSHIFEPNAQIP